VAGWHCVAIAVWAVMAGGCRADLRPPAPEPSRRPGPEGSWPADPGSRWPDAHAEQGPGRDADASRADRAASRDVRPSADAASSVPNAGGCGTQRPDVGGITHVDSLAIGADGTIYFMRTGPAEAWVGRLQPGGAQPELQWKRIPGSAMRLWGLAVDSRRSRLYVAAGEVDTIYRVDLTDDGPEPRPFVTDVQEPSDLAVDREGNLYFGERGDGKVHRVTPEGTRREVTPSRVGPGSSPAGIALGPDGALYVGNYGGPIIRVELEDGVEQRRGAWGEFSGRANGLAFDAAGRLYVGTYSTAQDAQLVRVDASESEPILIQSGPHFSSLAFGRGALDCKDLYIAVPTGPMRRITTDTPGAAMP
jgi:sugar lactone lactonase YvrE